MQRVVYILQQDLNKYKHHNYEEIYNDFFGVQVLIMKNGFQLSMNLLLMRRFKMKEREIVMWSVITVVSTFLPAPMTRRMRTIAIFVQLTHMFIGLNQKTIVILPIK